jgi:hypothetical protein
MAVCHSFWLSIFRGRLRLSGAHWRPRGVPKAGALPGCATPRKMCLLAFYGGFLVTGHPAPEPGVYVVHVGIMLLYLPELSRLQKDTQHSGLIGMLVGSLQRLHRPPTTCGGHIRGWEMLPLRRPFPGYACQSEPVCGSTFASCSAFRSHASARCREIGIVGSSGNGKRGASPIPGRFLAIRSSAARTAGDTFRIDSNRSVVATGRRGFFSAGAWNADGVLTHEVVPRCGPPVHGPIEDPTKPVAIRLHRPGTNWLSLAFLDRLPLRRDGPVRRWS